MPRYIDADEALRVMRNRKQDCPYVYYEKKVWDVAHDCAISCVDAAPTADVVEVKHGKWTLFLDSYGYTQTEEDYDDLYECSVCKNTVLGAVFNFCPWCGTKMECDSNV